MSLLFATAIELEDQNLLIKLDCKQIGTGSDRRFKPNISVRINIYRPQRSWGKVIFSQASVILLTGGGGSCGRGACVAEGCVHGGGCAWQGGVHGRGGVHGEGGMHGEGAVAWQRWGCMAGGVHSRGCAWQRGGMCGKGGACMAKGAVRGMHAPLLRDTACQRADGTHPTGMHSCSILL